MILVVDNYDSFTYNLVQLLLGPSGCEVEVLRNDAESAARDVGPETAARGSSSRRAQGRPEARWRLSWSWYGAAADPAGTLGVCLGHQILG